MLMRYIFLRLTEDQDGRLPVFIELRDLNHQPTTSLIELVRQRLSSYIENFSEAQLRYALSKDKIVLLLDGFDEIEYDHRYNREREIKELSGRYNNTHIFVSSRPFENVSGWERYFVFRVQSLTEKQVYALIKKIPYDGDIKLIFEKKLREGLYGDRKGFLANPLLCIMMLITIEYFADVPAKIHLFYGRAFDALFGRHDTTKGGFQRKMYAALPAGEFKKLFSYFSATTYIKQKISFSADDLSKYIKSAISSSQIQTDIALFKSDLIESTCMLKPDGLDYTFSHRSFQEYFTAYFLSQVATQEFSRAIPILVQRAAFDDVVPMLFEMNNEDFEKSWALPQLEKMCRLLHDIDGDRNVLEVHRRLFGDGDYFFISDDEIDIPSDDESEIVNARLVLYRLYGLFDKIKSNMNNKDESDVNIVNHIRSGKILAEDARFEAVRNHTDGELSLVVEGIRPEDSLWYADTYFGRFLRIEVGLLRILRDEVRFRVHQRTSGLSMLFSDLEKMERKDDIPF